MKIETYIPDLTYAHPAIQSEVLHPGPLIAVKGECEGEWVDFIVRDEPLAFASALEEVAKAIRRKVATR